VNDRVEYTCTARLEPTTVTVKPLPKRSVIRDLVTDTTPAEEKLESFNQERGQ